jgi:PH and SEC7 domain-containing protein
LTEIVKYASYTDSLQKAMSLRLKRRGEKALERALIVTNPDDDSPPEPDANNPQDTTPRAGNNSTNPIESPAPRRTHSWLWVNRREQVEG